MKAIYINLFTRIWSMATGVATIFFIVKFLSPADQGYYYTLNSLLALQVFIELGFNYSVVRIVGHEFGSSGLATNCNLLQTIRECPALLGVIQTYLRQSVRIGILTLIVLAPAGLGYFRYIHLDAQLSELWMMLVALVAVGIFMNTLLSVLEGLQRIKQVAIIRLAQAIFASVALWVSLACRLELHSLLVSLLVSYIGVLAIIVLIYKAELAYGLKNQGAPLLDSKRKSDRKYFQKIAVSGVSHYLMFQIYTPILTMMAGPVAAGQFAMSLQIITAINAFGLTWLSSNAPKLGRMIGAKQETEAKLLFEKILKLSSLMMGLLAIILACGAHYLASKLPDISARILPPFDFTLLLISAISNHIVFSWSAYLRARLDDPFWILAIVNACFTSLGALVLISAYGLEGATAAYFVSANIIGLIGGLLVFKRATISGAIA